MVVVVVVCHIEGGRMSISKQSVERSVSSAGGRVE